MSNNNDFYLHNARCSLPGSFQITYYSAMREYSRKHGPYEWLLRVGVTLEVILAARESCVAWSGIDGSCFRGVMDDGNDAELTSPLSDIGSFWNKYYSVKRTMQQSQSWRGILLYFSH